MKNLRILPFLLLAGISLSTSCGGSSSATKTSSSAPAHKTLSQRLEEKGGYKQDANGNWVPQSNKRSPYEDIGEDPNFAGKGYAKKEYKAGEYSKKSFWGNKEYDRQSYAGNTDGSRFQKTSGLQGKGAREAANTTNLRQDYKTGGYETGSAREAATKNIATTSNDMIDNRQKTFQQPEVIDWREQRKMTIDQSKGFFGR